MDIYLPIAEISVNVFLLLGIGGGIGALSGIFGVGGGFLMTPLLIFIGIPPGVAVATGANQIVAASISGVLAHWRRGNVDVKIGVVLLIGGLAGSTAGVGLFSFLKSVGQVDLVVNLCYVVFLGIIGSLMLLESIKAMMAQKAQKRKKSHVHNWTHGLPFKMKFRRSRLYISALLPLAVGFFVGLLSAVMGVGGGFVMVPAMIYLLGMPTVVVVGTSLFQIIFVTANVTLLQAVSNQTVDVVLAMLLIVGGVIGAQLGAQIGAKLKGEQLRGLLAMMVISVAIKLLIDLATQPADLYSVLPAGG
ncbi:MAG: sulfite exporter TauE/SafE family protein [Rhodospirillales bacterium]|nr:sulfite exporter TauE/SafE family protein [Rhodospirillales bacterium]MBO6786950.1 sulfite exporter TauE/SafE family protein [Rhodospirillales bacterium]